MIAKVTDKKDIPHGLRIPFEIADGIALAVLLELHDDLVEDLRAHEEDRVWMHPDDVEATKNRYLPALREIIPYLGGSDVWETRNES